MHVVFYHVLFGFRFHSIGCGVFVVFIVVKFVGSISMYSVGTGTDVGVFFQTNLREVKSKSPR